MTRPNTQTTSKMTYLANWWTAFERMRRTNKTVLNEYVKRLLQELTQAVLSADSGKAVHSENLEPTLAAPRLRRTFAAIRLLGRMWRQRRLLAQALPLGDDGSVGLIALSTRRLALTDSHSPRARIRSIARALPGASDPGRIGDEITACRWLLLFEPRPTSPLWARPQNCWDERIIIIDYVFLAFVLATSPAQMLREAWTIRRALLACLRIGREHALKAALKAIFFDVAYRVLLAEASSARAYIFAANSFATEVLRAFLIHWPKCIDICEILHGVPTLELEEYLATLFRCAPAGEDKHRFIPVISGFPLFGVYAPSKSVDLTFAVNTGLNNYLLAHRGHEAIESNWYAREYERVVSASASCRPLIVTFTGANSHDRTYVESDTFAIEHAIMRQTRVTLEEAGYPFVLCYTPHPLHPWSIFEDSNVLAECGVVLIRDTPFTWLIADVCIALHSSALFEAAYAGARVFTPMRVDDSIYPPSLLNRIEHPRSKELSFDALIEFVRAHACPPGDDLMLRMRERAARLWHVNIPTEDGATIAALKAN